MHAGGRPLVTLVLPAFNEAGVLESNVEAVMAYLASLEHAYRFEVLLINDGSSDDSGPIAERLRRRFHTLRLINHPLNFGLGQAFKTAFAVSRGDYVITFDVDLSYAPEHIGLLLETIVRERAKVVLASAYMPGGKVTNVPWKRHLLSRWGNRFLRFFARGNFSTLTCMVRAYDGPFVRRLFLRSTGMDIMPELVQKTMILNGRIVEVPAHLDWSRQLEAGPMRSSSMRVMRHIVSTLVSGFIFRPFVMLLLPGLLLFLFSIYVNAWVIYEFVHALPGADGQMHLAALVVYRDHPQTLFIGTLSLVLSVQLIGMGAMSLQSARYFKDTYYMGSELRRQLERASLHDSQAMSEPRAPVEHPRPRASPVDGELRWELERAMPDGSPSDESR
ncbi:MAG TPA: glycosyltransferase family 2 protein [Burkholderiaceae bacterium]|nr:glycosyltransferase family 2 protein [Burkholderiaceae bacterium]